MPFVSIKIAGPTLAPEQVLALQTRVTALLADVLHKNPEVTAVLVEQVSVNGWTIGARAVPVAAHVEAIIIAGTNTDDEKARFIADAAGLLKSVLGEALPSATYAVIRDVPADGWGYGGLTQSARRLKAKAA